MTMTNRTLALSVAAGSVDTHPGKCVYWIDSADHMCGKPTNDYLCARHVTVATRRALKAADKRRAQTDRRNTQLRSVNVDALRSERDALLAKQDRAAGVRRHPTDDLAAYGGIGIRQTARQKRKYADRVDNALGEYTRLQRLIEDLNRRISAAERAQTAKSDQ